jgi:hypothetical protein
MNFTEAIDRACQEPTLVDALSWIAVWECERVIPNAHSFLSGERPALANGQGWDSCFKYLIDETMKAYTVKKLKGG